MDPRPVGDLVVAARPDAGRFVVQEWRGSPGEGHGLDPGGVGPRPLAAWWLVTSPALNAWR